MLDRRTNELLPVNGGYNPWYIVTRLYVLGLEGGRQLIPMEDCVNQTRISLERCVQSCDEEFLKTVKKDEAKNQETTASSETSRSVENKLSRNGRKNHNKGSLQDRFKIRGMRIWLRKGQTTIDKFQVDSKCRTC